MGRPKGSKNKIKEDVVIGAVESVPITADVKNNEVVYKFPKTETGPSILCVDSKGIEFVITNNPLKDTKAFTLWKILNEGKDKSNDIIPEKIMTADTPMQLYDKIWPKHKSQMVTGTAFDEEGMKYWHNDD